MKRRLKENIEIGDRVFATRDEYQGTVIDINGDEVLVDGPFGEEYHNLNDLEKLGGDYEEDDTPNFFKKRFTESKRKKIIRLTESDLTRIVRRVINEDEEKKNKLDMYSQIYRYLEGKIGGIGDLHSMKHNYGGEPRPRWSLSWNCKPPFYDSPDESKEWAADIEPSFIDRSSGKVDGAELYLYFKKNSDTEDSITEWLGQPVKKNIQFDFLSKKYDGFMFNLKSKRDAEKAAYVISQILD